MKIYVASSWRNDHQPKVCEVLRAAGHEVYDFRNPKPGNEGFSWRQVDPTHKPGDPVTAEHWRRLVDYPVALEGYALDMGAMEWADACVYVLPCGRSASFEAGWFFGQRKPLVVLALDPTEPELMFREATIVGSLAEMLDALPSRVAMPVAITRVLKRLRPLAEIGQRVIDYFADTGECLLCDVDADRENGGPPVHEEHCNLAPVCGEGQEGKEPKSDSVSAALPVDQGGEPR